jgi:hypothetical protein
MYINGTRQERSGALHYTEQVARGINYTSSTLQQEWNTVIKKQEHDK